jgi:N-acetylglucosaminyldiphosphoundecaprenol N-acetyl-beta-D-mannosaminyltransferase
VPELVSSPPAGPTVPQNVRVLGMPLDPVRLADVAATVAAGLQSRRGGAIVTPNVEILRQYRRSLELRRVLERVDLRVADGTPVVWASRLQGTPVPERITGTAIIWALAAVAAAHDAAVFVAGGQADVAARAAERLRAEHPTLRVSSRACYVRPDRAISLEVAALVATLVADAPDIVFIGLPLASQVHLIETLREGMPNTWFVGVGSAFDFVNGDRTRAPLWVQRAGLEWLHRLGQQPWLWRRYLVDGLPFAAYLLGRALAARLRVRPSRHG